MDQAGGYLWQVEIIRAIKWVFRTPEGVLDRVRPGSQNKHRITKSGAPSDAIGCQANLTGPHRSVVTTRPGNTLPYITSHNGMGEQTRYGSQQVRMEPVLEELPEQEFVKGNERFSDSIEISKDNEWQGKPNCDLISIGLPVLRGISSGRRHTEESSASLDSGSVETCKETERTHTGKPGGSQKKIIQAETLYAAASCINVQSIGELDTGIRENALRYGAPCYLVSGALNVDAVSSCVRSVSASRPPHTWNDTARDGSCQTQPDYDDDVSLGNVCVRKTDEPAGLISSSDKSCTVDLLPGESSYRCQTCTIVTSSCPSPSTCACPTIGLSMENRNAGLPLPACQECQEEEIVANCTCGSHDINCNVTQRLRSDKSICCVCFAQQETHDSIEVGELPNTTMGSTGLNVNTETAPTEIGFCSTVKSDLVTIKITQPDPNPCEIQEENTGSPCESDPENINVNGEDESDSGIGYTYERTPRAVHRRKNGVVESRSPNFLTVPDSDSSTGSLSSRASPPPPLVLSDDGSDNDMDNLKAVTARLKLPTRRPSFVAWREQVTSKPLLAHYRPEEGDSRAWTPERKDEINDAIKWLRRELIEMREVDQLLARQLIRIRDDLHSLKLQRRYEETKELVEDAIDCEEKDEIDDFCDIPRDPFSPTLKQYGVTRMNISARRFSVF